MVEIFEVSVLTQEVFRYRLKASPCQAGEMEAWVFSVKRSGGCDMSSARWGGWGGEGREGSP